jgi:hypothetical protein
VKSLGSSTANVKSLDSSTAHIDNYDSSNLKYSLGEGECPVIKHFTEKKVFIKTTEFQIVQIN